MCKANDSSDKWKAVKSGNCEQYGSDICDQYDQLNQLN
jgi:hypothetical protein